MQPEGQSNQQKRGRGRSAYTQPQRTLLAKVFRTHISNGTLPKMSECEEVAKKYAIELDGRDARSLYSHVQYKMKKAIMNGDDD